jgi:hypothetical protein
VTACFRVNGRRLMKVLDKGDHKLYITNNLLTELCSVWLKEMSVKSSGNSMNPSAF